jgi:hypothetical protein
MPNSLERLPLVRQLTARFAFPEGVVDPAFKPTYEIFSRNAAAAQPLDNCTESNLRNSVFSCSPE